MAILQKHFLLADDDADDLDLLREALLQVQSGARIASVGTGMEVLAYLTHCLKDDLPELIIFDYDMPGMNGASVIEALAAKEQFRGIPVLVWSTSNAQHHRAECEEKGGQSLLLKTKQLSTGHDNRGTDVVLQELPCRLRLLMLLS